MEKVDYKSELNNEQYQAVTQADGPSLVLAGAGSGKTRTIVYRVAYLIEKGIKPENILLLTFTNRAAREMLTRVKTLLKGRETKGLWGGTFHHVANRILRRFASLIGYSSKFTILDEEDSHSLIRICIKELNINTKERRFPSPAVLKGIISFCKNSEKKLKDVLELKHSQWLEILPEIKNVFHKYEEKKKKNNLMDFDDLLTNLLLLLKTKLGPYESGGKAVKEQLTKKFHYILVDEYQDTNKIQAAIIRELADFHKNILVVGDDAQSIYSFRAADLANILNFPKIFSKTKIFHLKINYRSTPEILDLANEIIAQNKNQFPKDLISFKKKFIKPYLVAPSSTAEEAVFISRMVLELKNEGISLNKIAVLFRASHHSQELEFELTRKNISYDYRGGLRFFERAHIKDVIAFLKIINNIKDEVAWFRILNLQAGIGDVTARKFISVFIKLKNIKDCLKENLDSIISNQAKSGWLELKNIFNSILKNESFNPSEFIKNLIKSSYRSYLVANFQNYQERLEDLEQLSVFADKYKDLNSFLAEITMQEDFSVIRTKANFYKEDNEEKIILSTIHQAKGLEWEVVFIINLIDQGLPNPRALKEEGGLEEERRLFYVAVTRAQKKLFLTYPLTGSYNSMYLSSPSPFLKELPEDIWEELPAEEEKTDFSKLSDGGISYLPEIDEL